MTLFLPKSRTKVVRGRSEPSVCHRSQGGWKSSYCSPLPVEGEIFFLTFPFIDQAITLVTFRLQVKWGFSSVEDHCIGHAVYLSSCRRTRRISSESCGVRSNLDGALALVATDYQPGLVCCVEQGREPY